MSTPVNPYAAPQSVVADVGERTDPQAEAIRREHLGHEASMRAVGTLYYLGGFAMAFPALGMLLSAFGPPVLPADASAGLFIGLFVVLTIVFLALGRGLRRLRPWVLIPASVVTALGLLGFPIGTLINGYILWLLLSQKGRFILSPGYSEIVAATPHIKYRTSILVWIVVGLILAGIVAAMVVPMVVGYR